MFLHKFPLERLRLYINDLYEKNKEVDITIDYSITSEIKFINTIERYLLILKINRSYFDEENGKEIIGYSMVSINVIKNKIEKSDKDELSDLIGHIHSTVNNLWQNICPLRYLRYKPLLDENAETDKVWACLKKEFLLIDNG